MNTNSDKPLIDPPVYNKFLSKKENKEREEFKCLFFNKRWLATKDKDIAEVACDGLWSWHQRKKKEFLEDILKIMKDSPYMYIGKFEEYIKNLEEK